VDSGRGKPSRTIIGAYALLSLLVLTDFLWATFSGTHRNDLGAVSGIGDLAFRFTPGLCLLAFYSVFFFSLIRTGEVRRSLIVIHSLACASIGLGIALPFLGLFVAHLTPIYLIYSSIVDYVGPPYGYGVIIGLALAFSSFNIGVLVNVLRGKQMIHER
jgi:hypothetical protein